MIFQPIPQLQTPRLTLRKFCLSDVDGHHRYITSDPEVAKAMLWQANPERVHAEEVLKRIISRYGTQDEYRWAIVRHSDGAYLGTVSLLRIDQEQSSCSFAYMLGKPFWNQGYMTEALEAVFRFAFVDMQLVYIEADHFADNPASGAVMRKAGMRQVAVLPNRYEKDGLWHDAVCYRITKEEWSD